MPDILSYLACRADEGTMTSRRAFIARGSTAVLGAAALPPGLLAGVAPPGVRHASGSDDPEIAAILRRVRPPQFPPRVVRVTEFGAVGDGRADCRAAFARAIARCNAEGGGRVVVPAGTWWTEGPIHLKSNIELHLEEGATIRFTPDADRYLPLVLTRWEGTELFNYSPQIYAWQATNVAITGTGTIDGNAGESFAQWKPHQVDAQNRLRQMGIDGVPVQERVFGQGHWLRPSMIQFLGCRNVLVENVRITGAPFWVVHPVYSQNVIARGLRIESRYPNNDGVDPDSCVDVLIERCSFDTGDDSVAVKSGRDQDGWRVGQPTENVVIRDCEMNSRHAGLCIGSEMSAGVRNVFLENCRLGKVETAIYFKSNLDRGGLVEHIRVRGMTVREADRTIHFTTDYHGYRGGRFPTAFRDIEIERVTCGKAGTGIRAVGVPDSPLRDITMRDVTIGTTANPNEIRHVANLTLTNVRINGELVQ